MDHADIPFVLEAAQNAAGQSAGMVTEASDAPSGSAMEGVFSAPVACAYATSERGTFDAKYADAMAAACGAGPGLSTASCHFTLKFTQKSSQKLKVI